MFYTQVITSKNQVIVFYREEGQKYIFTDSNFCPSAFFRDEYGPYKDIYFGHKVSEKRFKSLYDFNQTPLRHDSNYPFYSDIHPKYQYIRKMFGSEEIQYDPKNIKIANVDIENPEPKENGFPDAIDAKFPIKTITLSIRQGTYKKIYAFGFFHYEAKENEIYIQCENERDLLEQFAQIWAEEAPDIVIGWNIDNFDIPYIIKRMEFYGISDRLSPVGIVYSNVNQNYERLRQSFKGAGFRYNPKFYNTIAGTEVLDLFWLYKKFRSNNMESFTLDFIGKEELGKGKLAHDTYKDLYDLYVNDFQKFMEYNIRDVEIVDELDVKINFTGIQISLAYLAHVNYHDVFSPVKTWEVYLYNILLEEGFVLPFKKVNPPNDGYAGAYTMHITPCYHKWITAHDLDGLYPHIMMQYNMSFEKKVGYITDHMEISPALDRNQVDDRLIHKTLDLSILKENNWTMTANGILFDMSEQGIIPKILESIYFARKTAKKQMLALQQEMENDETKNYSFDIAALNAKQNALKVFLNSYYGIIGNEAFVLYDVDIALAVTLSAQLSIKWIINYVGQNVDKRFDFKVIYGDTDSVSGDSIVTIMCDGIIRNVKISDLIENIVGDISIEGNGRTILEPDDDIQVLCFDKEIDTPVFRKIKYIMRKKNMKKLYRVAISNSEVVVTEDHSLIAKDEEGYKDISAPNLIKEKHSLIVYS